MTSEETAEMAALRAEVNQLRRELDRVLGMLDQPNSREPDYQPPQFPNMEFSQVSVRHARERIPVILYSGDDENGLFLYDSKHQVRAQLVIDDQDRARLEVRNAEGKTVLVIGEGAHGGGDVLTFGPEGEPRAAMRGLAAAGVVNVVDAKGGVLGALGGMAGGGQLVLFTAAQRQAVSAKASERGGIVTVHEPSGQIMGFLIGSPEGATLTLNGEQGTAAATLTGHGELGGNAVFYQPDGETKAMLP